MTGKQICEAPPKSKILDWSRRCFFEEEYKVKGGNLERQVIWNSQAKSSVNHKLHPLFLVCIVSMKGEFGSSKNDQET